MGLFDKFGYVGFIVVNGRIVFDYASSSDEAIERCKRTVEDHQKGVVTDWIVLARGGQLVSWISTSSDM